MEGIARPGAICLSEDAYRQVKGRLDLAVIDLGPTQLKNIAEPIRIYSLQIGTSADDTSATPEKPSPPPVPDKPSIAVLAFNNMSGDAEQEYFSDGITEDIITDLSRLSELHVIARNSSFVYKNAAVSIPEVAKALGVRYVLEGSVRKASTRVRVTAQLIDSSSGGHVWASRFDRDLSDIFAVQDELTQEIVSALKLKLTGCAQDHLAPRRAVNVQAYELFLRGRELSWATTGPGNIAARGLFERAIAIDPGYAAAYALTAFTHLIDYANAFSGDPALSLRTGLELAQRAVEMDEEEPASRFALGVAHTWRRELDPARTPKRSPGPRPFRPSPWSSCSCSPRVSCFPATRQAPSRRLMPLCGWIRTIWKSRCKLSPMRAFPSASMRKRLPQSSSGWHEIRNQRPLMPSLRHATGTLAEWRKVDGPGNR